MMHGMQVGPADGKLKIKVNKLPLTRRCRNDIEHMFKDVEQIAVTVTFIFQ